MFSKIFPSGSLDILAIAACSFSGFPKDKNKNAKNNDNHIKMFSLGIMSTVLSLVINKMKPDIA